MEITLWTYRARCSRVVDGDTIDVIIDQGFRQWRTERLRLLGVDTPEMRGAERPAGIAAKEYVEEWVKGFGDWPLKIRTEKSDSFGRYLATVWRQSDGRCLQDDLWATGHAKIWVGRTA